MRSHLAAYSLAALPVQGSAGAFSCFRQLFLALVAVAVFGLAGCGGKVELLANIPERDINDVIAELLNKGISATKIAGKEGNASVQVPTADVARALDVLRVAGLPRESFKAMGQVFTKDGLISSPLEERARYLYALSQELSGTLANIDGVLFARVHLVLPERGTGLEKGSPSSAAVFIKHRAEYDIEILQPQVRRLVANSIPDLTAERVTVVLVASTSKPVPAPDTVSVMGVKVPPGAAAALESLLWAMIVGMVLLGAVAVGAGYLAWRARSATPLESDEAA
ncbi:MAG: type III secretion system inner membrane ring lipoprotein SctJ [Betaproteobacteria bacterium]